LLDRLPGSLTQEIDLIGSFMVTVNICEDSSFLL